MQRSLKTASTILSTLAVLGATAHAATPVWNGGASGSWATATNWNPVGVPLAADNVVVGSSAAVTDATNVFTSLDIQAGAAVTMVTDMNQSNTVKVEGTLNRAGGVYRLGHTNIELTGTGSLGAGITWLDTFDSTMSFTDGASFGNPNMGFEHKGTNVFNYTLSATGFRTLIAGGLYSGTYYGGSAATWSNVTYNIDVSNYNLSNGTVVTLVDYASGTLPGNFATDAKVNIIAGSSGLNPKVTFNTSTSALIVTFPKVWDGGAAGSWATATNWNPDQVPLAADEVIVGSNASVTDGTSTFSRLEIQAGAKVTMGPLANGFLSGKTLKVAGTLDYVGVFRPYSTLNLSGSLGTNITFLDTGSSTMTFTDGASFGNPSMPFQQNANVFNYILSPTGFTTLHAGSLYGSSWSAVTYNIDISNYNPSNGTIVTLAQYGGRNIAGNFADAHVNVIAGSSGLTPTLAFDAVNSKLVLNFATNAYDSWATTNSVTGGKLGDDDNDGLSNLVEYAFGTNPHASNGSPIHLATNGSGNLELSATKGAAAGVDSATTYGVEASFDLRTWTTNGVTITTNDATHLVASYAGPPAAPAGKVFLRAVISN